MKKFTLVSIALVAGTFALHAEGDPVDTTRTERLEEAVVKAVRSGKNSPFAVTQIDRSDLATHSKSGKELPFLFSRTPGIIAWSENGLGTGTSYMRIRGAGDSRINVTIDGVALNSPEDQCVFWANMNSYSALLGSVQIQRGVGTSTNGDGAFGGTISLSSKAPSIEPSAEVTASYGSYNTWRAGASISTGLIGKHLIIDGSYHETHTDGFIHGTSGRSGSYYGGITWMGNSFSLRYKNIGNFESTGQAWNGVVAGDYDGYCNLNEAGVKSYKDLWDLGLGKVNTLYEYAYGDENGKIVTERYKMNDGSFWKRTTDNFKQNHNILSAVWEINPHWNTTASLHYTYGYGYYEDFKYNNKLAKYGLPNLTLSDGKTLKKTDFVRQKGLKQHTYGAVWNINYESRLIDFTGGANWQNFSGNHFGYLTYIANEELSKKYLSGGNYQYYDSDARKSDVSAFAKATFHVSPMWDIFGDLQFRHVGYVTNGYNDKYHSDLSKHELDIDEKWNFFNPKAGVTFHNDGHKAYASGAVSHREPERNNFTDNGKYPAPKAERLVDIETGYEYASTIWNIAANLYYMDYRNQFVQTGQTSDIGEALTTNIKDSYRAGAEISAAVSPLEWLTIEGNTALSINKIRNFDEIIEENYDAEWNYLESKVNHYANSPLAYSPSVIANGFVTFHPKHLNVTWHTAYVGKQFLDNSASNDRSIPAYCVSSLSAQYRFTFGKRFCGMKEMVIGADLNNIFNSHYAASGFIWYQSIVDGTRHSQLSYIPAAGFTAMANITFRF